MEAGVIAAIVLSGLLTGALARLALPGPDPMPLWLTLAIGLTGSIVGAVAGRALFDENGYVVSFGSLFVAIALVALYRRFVQHRPLWGPEAMQFPRRGLGVDGYRERLSRLGVDPDALATAPVAGDESARLLASLEQLHRAGILDDEEFRAKRTLLLERQRSDT